MQENGFIKCPYEHALYINNKEKDVLIVFFLYIDDLIFTGSNISMFRELKKMIEEFEITDIGLMTFYLGIEVNQMQDGNFISQEGYAQENLKKFKMKNSKPINTLIDCGVKILKYNE